MTNEQTEEILSILSLYNYAIRDLLLTLRRYNLNLDLCDHEGFLRTAEEKIQTLIRETISRRELNESER